MTMHASTEIAELHPYLIQGVCEAGHELGRGELRLLALELRLLLHCEAGGLEAQLVDRVVAGLDVLQVAGAAVNDWAGVGNTRALDLQVCQALELVEGDGLGWGLRGTKRTFRQPLPWCADARICRSSQIFPDVPPAAEVASCAHETTHSPEAFASVSCCHARRCTV